MYLIFYLINYLLLFFHFLFTFQRYYLLLRVYSKRPIDQPIGWQLQDSLHA